MDGKAAKVIESPWDEVEVLEERDSMDGTQG
jgi:hypothetical protein